MSLLSLARTMLLCTTLGKLGAWQAAAPGNTLFTAYSWAPSMDPNHSCGLKKELPSFENRWSFLTYKVIFKGCQNIGLVLLHASIQSV